MTEKDKKPTADWIADMAIAATPCVEMLERAMGDTGERKITTFLKWGIGAGIAQVLLAPAMRSADDTVVFDYRLKVGTADIVIFHIDGAATVVELKDGDQGFRSVIGGLGQAGLYAAQLDPARALKEVRRALAWTPVPEPRESNRLIQQACLDAGAIPVFLPAVDGMIEQCMRTQLLSIMRMAKEAFDGTS